MSSDFSPISSSEALGDLPPLLQPKEPLSFSHLGQLFLLFIFVTGFLVFAGVLFVKPAVLNPDLNASDSNARNPLLPPVVCGNGVCEQGETIHTCLLDCFACNENTVCEPDIGENSNSCVKDCPAPVCDSDGVCEAEQNENTLNCSADCPEQAASPGKCGDDFCALTESCNTCAADCGTCALCGNNKIDPKETCDGTQLASQTCQTNGFKSGALSCNSTCTAFDTAKCVPFPAEVCGDEIDNDSDGALDNGCAAPKTFYFIDQSLPAECITDYNVQSRACGAVRPTHRAFNSFPSLLSAHTTGKITLRAGDTILVRDGEYSGGIFIPVTMTGTPEKPIKFASYTGETIRLTLAKTYSSWGTDANGFHALALTPEMIASDNLITHSAGIVVLHLIRRNESGVSRVTSYMDLVERPILSTDCSQVSGPCRDNLGYGPNLSMKDYDLFYFNEATKTIYLGLREGSPAFSPADFFVAGPAQRIEVNGQYIEFNGFTIGYGYETIKPNVQGVGLRVINNSIGHTPGSCLLIGGNNALIEKNKIEWCGSPIAFTPDGFYRLNQNHAIYYTSADGIIRYNDMDVTYKFGETLSLYNGTYPLTLPSNVSVYQNIIRNGISLTGIGNKIYNNLVVTKGAYGLSMISGRDHEIYHNLFWVPVVQGSAAVTLSTSFPVSGFRFQNNIVMTNPTWGQYCLHTAHTDRSSPQIKISNNQYYNCTHFGAYDADGNILRFEGFSAWGAFMSPFQQENGSVFGDPALDASYHSGSSSVGLNRGASIPLVTTDYANNPRPAGSGVDIGPFEQ